MTSPSKSRDWSDCQIDNNAIQSYVKTGSHCQCSILNCGWTNVTWGQTFTKCILSLKLCLNFSAFCLYWKYIGRSTGTWVDHLIVCIQIWQIWFDMTGLYETAVDYLLLGYLGTWVNLHYCFWVTMKWGKQG